MCKYISFVFHQKSANQEVKKVKSFEEEQQTNEDSDYEEKDDPEDSDYSG